MLSEKFVLVLEAILKPNGRGFPDGAPRVVRHLAARPGQAARQQVVRSP
jgi:hypothetical protein